uniref:CD300c molecule n=1 Tax=Rhinopithecus bieti TaxID=61621 RepID=A0A2K6N4Z2_RHIBE
MTARAWASWRPSALLLLLVPGEWAGPGLGELCSDVTMKETRLLNKYWCDTTGVLPCDRLVETKGPDRKNERPVSIRDLTLENLTEEDAGNTGVGWPRRVIVQVELFVFPASSPQSSMGTSGPPTKLPVHTWPSVTRKDGPEPSPHPGSLFSNVRFLLLVFLELPLLLSMLGAVLWVNRPQRSSRSRQSWPENENQ